VPIGSRLGGLAYEVAQHVRVQDVVQVVHGAQVVYEHLALRNLGIIDAGIVATRVTGDLNVASADRLKDFIVAQITVIQSSLNEVVQQHFYAAL